MTKQIALILTIFYSVLNLNAQQIKFRENLNKDSLFNVSVQKVPLEMRENFIKTYKDGNEQEKEFLLFMISMPESSKKELIQNFVSKKSEIQKLKNEYIELIPKDYNVEIEFKPRSEILTVEEEITIKIYNSKIGGGKLPKRNGLQVENNNWNLKPNSNELAKVLKYLNWTNETLLNIKNLLKDANCISIGNGINTKIGFARGGMGLYSYLIFNNNLSPKQIEEYNNGCEYIFYKENVVLQYGGGAIGPQCFEKE
ncbi:hypothetical protein [Algoriella sp.]|uniref:hypothetical protein n=1 Tax=Algoriella sp. TaxID=1872434 RepID=UPI002FC5ED7E